MLNLISESRLNPADFHQKIEFLIPEFLPRRMITMFYAEGGSGKSWLAYAIASYAASVGQQVIYLDYDNPITVLADRGLEHKLIGPYNNLYYVSSSKTDLTSEQIIEHIRTENGNLDGTVLVIDSLRDFCDVKNDNQTLHFMTTLKGLRERGATVIVLSHSNKDARNYEGSNNIYNSLDNMYQIQKLDSAPGQINYLFKLRKSRAGTGDSAWSLDTETLTLNKMDLDAALVSTEDQEFIGKVKEALTKSGGVNKKELLEALGYDKRDKTANLQLKRYEGRHWTSVKKSNVYTYHLPENTKCIDVMP